MKIQPPPQKGAEPPPNFRLISIVDKRLDASRCHSVYGGRPQPRRVYVRWGSSPPQKGAEPPRIEVENFEIRPEAWALPVIASFVALEQQIILVKTRSESV